MTEERFLKIFKYLKPVHINNLYRRFLDTSDGDMLLLFNKERDRYELHSLRTFQYTYESLNVVVPEDMLNGWIITDYRANDVRKFGQEVEAERYINDTTLSLYEDRGLDLLQQRALKTIEQMVGRDL